MESPNKVPSSQQLLLLSITFGVRFMSFVTLGDLPDPYKFPLSLGSCMFRLLPESYKPPCFSKTSVFSSSVLAEICFALHSLSYSQISVDIDI